MKSLILNNNVVKTKFYKKNQFVIPKRLKILRFHILLERFKPLLQITTHFHKNLLNEILVTLKMNAKLCFILKIELTFTHHSLGYLGFKCEDFSFFWWV